MIRAVLIIELTGLVLLNILIIIHRIHKRLVRIRVYEIKEMWQIIKTLIPLSVIVGLAYTGFYLTYLLRMILDEQPTSTWDIAFAVCFAVALIEVFSIMQYYES